MTPAPNPAPGTEAELLPCPLCGGRAEMWKASVGGVRDLQAWIACMGRCVVLVTKEYTTNEAAIAAWNRRAPGPDAAGLLAALEGLLGDDDEPGYFDRENAPSVIAARAAIAKFKGETT